MKKRVVEKKGKVLGTDKGGGAGGGRGRGGGEKDKLEENEDEDKEEGGGGAEREEVGKPSLYRWPHHRPKRATNSCHSLPGRSVCPGRPIHRCQPLARQ